MIVSFKFHFVTLLSRHINTSEKNYNCVPAVYNFVICEPILLGMLTLLGNVNIPNSIGSHITKLGIKSNKSFVPSILTQHTKFSEVIESMQTASCAKLKTNRLCGSIFNMCSIMSFVESFRRNIGTKYDSLWLQPKQNVPGNVIQRSSCPK